MGLSYRTIARTLGMVIAIIGVAMIPALMVSILYKETSTIIGFAICIVPMVVLGFLSYTLIKPNKRRISVRDSMLLVSLVWLAVAAFGSLPYLSCGVLDSFADSFFETASGFTTTGASIFPDVESLPQGLIFWRSLTHWLGGMGILVLIVVLLPSLGSGHSFIKAEASTSLTEKLLPRTSDSLKLIYFLYIGLTLVLIFLLMIGGLNLFDAVIHAFGAISTGGFSNYNDGIMHFNSSYINWVLMIFMMLSSINFTLYFWLISRHWKDFFKDEELRWFIFITLFAALFVSANLVLSYDSASYGKSIELGFFNVISIISTTGFSNSDYNLWPTFSKMIILILMFIGGCSSSTSGGIKVVRINILMKLVYRNISRRLHPNAVVSIKYDGKNVPSDMVSAIVAHSFLYLVLVVLGTLIINLTGADFITALTSVASSLGNIGPGFDLVGPIHNYNFLPDYGKVLLGFLMIAGRLELLTMILLFTPQFWRND